MELNEKRKEYVRKYKQENKEKLLEKRRKYEIKNKDKVSAKKREYQQKHNYHNSVARKKYKENHKDAFKLYAHKSKLKRYGITIDDYNNMIESQNGKCAICGIDQIDCYRIFDIDHNHATGKVRGLLCYNCNAGIGQLKEDVNILSKAIDYLNNDKG